MIIYSILIVHMIVYYFERMNYLCINFNSLTIHLYFNLSIFSVEQMPTVSRSDCTQVDLTESIKITFDADSNTFKSKLKFKSRVLSSLGGERN